MTPKTSNAQMALCRLSTTSTQHYENKYPPLLTPICFPLWMPTLPLLSKALARESNQENQACFTIQRVVGKRRLWSATGSNQPCERCGIRIPGNRFSCRCCCFCLRLLFFWPFLLGLMLHKRGVISGKVWNAGSENNDFEAQPTHVPLIFKYATCT